MNNTDIEIQEKEENKTFYYCYIRGRNAPQQRHYTYAGAQKEAKRLLERVGQEVEILQCVAKCQVSPKIVKMK